MKTKLKHNHTNEIRSKLKIKNNDENLEKFAKLNELQQLMNIDWNESRYVEKTVETLSNESKRLFPLKSFVPKPNTKLLENDPQVKILIEERERYLEVMQYSAIGSSVWVHDDNLKLMNKMITREKVRAKKRLIEQKLEQANSSKSCWDILKIMMNNI